MGVVGVTVENVLAGVGAALLVGVAIRAKNLAYAKYLERQYPIAGEYITTWEQQRDGETVTESAPATLEQRGKRVIGRSTMPGGDLEWKFDGEISETGYLNGLYYSLDPHNNSIGNFFFHINHDGTLEGLWAGYQQRTDQIQSGRYTFVPVFDAYTVSALRKRDLPAVIDIAEQRLDTNDRSVERMGRSLTDDSACFTRVARVETSFETERSIAGNLTDALLGNTPNVRKGGPGDPGSTSVLGFCLASVFDQSAFREQLNVSHTTLPKALQHADEVGVIHAVAVRSEFQNRGLGTALVAEAIRECADQGSTALCAVGRETDTADGIGGIMNHFGFRMVGRVDGYWSETDGEPADTCDRCRETPCTCTAVIYARYQPTRPRISTS